MGGGTIGPLIEADEFLNHQIVETFATVLHTDPSWAEKICLMAASKDGRVQVAFGLGKYTNRNVLDGYAGISQGLQQWNVRASRELGTDINSLDVSPLRYDILEPLKRIRISLEPNPTQPIAFELVLEGKLPCVTEQREDRRTHHGFRRTADQIRYHQIGVASGWLEICGVREQIDPEDWVMTRDHSWGIRPQVGAPLMDVAPEAMESGDTPQVFAIWNPMLMQNAQGDAFGFHQYHLHYSGRGFKHELLQGGFEYANGRRDPLVSLTPNLRFDSKNQRLLGGSISLSLASGARHIFEVNPLQGTGFYLAGGLYHGFDGKFHGQWRGTHHVEGEYFEDCTEPSIHKRLGQFRDCLIEMSEPSTGIRGWGNCQTYLHGHWPDLCQ